MLVAERALALRDAPAARCLVRAQPASGAFHTVRARRRSMRSWAGPPRAGPTIGPPTAVGRARVSRWRRDRSSPRRRPHSFAAAPRSARPGAPCVRLSFPRRNCVGSLAESESQPEGFVHSHGTTRRVAVVAEHRGGARHDAGLAFAPSGHSWFDTSPGIRPRRLEDLPAYPDWRMVHW